MCWAEARRKVRLIRESEAKGWRRSADSTGRSLCLNAGCARPIARAAHLPKCRRRSVGKRAPLTEPKCRRHDDLWPRAAAPVF